MKAQVEKDESPEAETLSRLLIVGYLVGAGHSVSVVAGAGDTNVCGGIVQLYWDNILGKCLDFSEQVHQSALKVRI